MKLKALDTLHISSVKSDNIAPNERFEVSDADGKSLIERGLAVEVKAERKASNKMAAAPGNKARGSAKAK
jgi:hypothetical protein